MPFEFETLLSFFFVFFIFRLMRLFIEADTVTSENKLMSFVKRPSLCRAGVFSAILRVKSGDFCNEINTFVNLFLRDKWTLITKMFINACSACVFMVKRIKYVFKVHI